MTAVELINNVLAFKKRLFLSDTQLRVLLALAANQGQPMRIGELSNSLGCSHSTISEAVYAMSHEVRVERKHKLCTLVHLASGGEESIRKMLKS